MSLAYKGFSKIAVGLSSCIHLITAGWGILMCFTIAFCSKKRKTKSSFPEELG